MYIYVLRLLQGTTYINNLSLASALPSASMQSCTTAWAEEANTWMFLIPYLERNKNTTNLIHKTNSLLRTEHARQHCQVWDVAGITHMHPRHTFACQACIACHRHSNSQCRAQDGWSHILCCLRIVAGGAVHACPLATTGNLQFKCLRFCT